MSLKRSTLKRFCCDTSLSAKHPGEFWRKMKPPLKTSSGKNTHGVVLGLWPKSLVTTLHGSKRALLCAILPPSINGANG